MIKIKQLILNEMTSVEILAEMANIDKKYSNLSVKLWIGYHNGSKHFVPYIKIMKFGSNQAMASISIGDQSILAGNIDSLSGKEIKKIREFIVLNKDTLLYYYYHAGEEGFDVVNDLYHRLQSV